MAEDLRTRSPVCELIARSSCADEHAKKTGACDELLEKAVIAFADLMRYISLYVGYTPREQYWSTCDDFGR